MTRIVAVALIVYVGISLSQHCRGEEEAGTLIIPPVPIDTAVALTVKYGGSITVMQVTDMQKHRGLVTGLGERGMDFRIAAEPKVLYQGKTDDYYGRLWKKDDWIKLGFYKPKNDSKIIVMYGATSGWMPYSEESEKHVLDALEKLKKQSAENAIKKP